MLYLTNVIFTVI